MTSVEVAKLVKSAVVAIAYPYEPTPGKPVFRIVGTGFNISPSGLIVTCSHVMMTSIEQEHLTATHLTGRMLNVPVKQPSILVIFEGEDGVPLAFEGRIDEVAMNPKTDVALLTFLDDPRGPWKKGEYPAIELDALSEREGEPIGTAGFPFGDDLSIAFGSYVPSFTFGHISAVHPIASDKRLPTQYQLDLSTHVGNSGGPIFRLSDGKVIGMLRGGLTSPTELNRGKSIGISVGIPSHFIADQVSEWRAGEAERNEIKKQIKW